MKQKKGKIKKKKEYVRPDIRQLEIEKLRNEWDFEVFGLCGPSSGFGPCCGP
jgi:hypothetical protein